MDVYEYPWLSAENVHGYLRTFVDFLHGHPWVSKDIQCPWRMFMDIYGHLRTFAMDIHGYLRISMDVHGECSWILMDICGHL